ncbi:hypothetical protein SAPIO_CDS8843 [Scedosporium apiospermum]|uniref:Uncharacterized protein n=1 Tax=Pseudallescheria apiosperma TaxID=563466 RepID=A0A084FXS8_PSEDA|nr:uncharacterized protein SAPIO_CDS8843 [Scedosporium apiospermum]KEZ39890.1 hypothetical protein SAPIO_CDS8843 [Scedosporium apiospermum]
MLFCRITRALRPRLHLPSAPFRTSRPSSTTPNTRASKILSKLPPSLQKYTTRLRNAPVSHVVAFLILHEITAIVPLFGLFGVFHYTQYAPVGYITDHWGGVGVGYYEGDPAAEDIGEFVGDAVVCGRSRPWPKNIYEENITSAKF